MESEDSEDSEDREEVGSDTEEAEDIVMVLDALVLDALDVLLAASSFLFFLASVLVACRFRCSR